ncbi:sodium:solute symporter [Wocania ichthyoenteri]|uniref:sodium:solute symporter n=1 Tax=Wocania ichthyoenteri TaxID=1230531 RepID=UPI00053D00D7|nr:sodium:solute symporter [Wocania ichthyoenteri]
MRTSIGVAIFIIYISILLLIAYLSSDKESNNDLFFTSNRDAKWSLVAFGMIGASLSGITFISVPGEVGNNNFYYLQIVIGYMVGYTVISYILIPLYYKLKLVSIYEYLGNRFGRTSQKAGAIFFLVSQAVGASLRLLIVALVLQKILFDNLNIPFEATVIFILFFIWLYTKNGGIKTIIYTDTLQTLFILIALFTMLIYIMDQINVTSVDLSNILISQLPELVFNWEFNEGSNFFKQFIAGVFIAISMTGLDQNMMQKSLACKSIKESQKNILFFSIALFLTNLLFLILGFLLFEFIKFRNISFPKDVSGEFINTDQIYGTLALEHTPEWIGIIFLLGVIAASFSSADSSMTALTTSAYQDLFFKVKKNPKKLRKQIHMVVVFVVLIIILCFYYIKDDSIINYALLAAGYTYGPLLGLFTFGLVTNYRIKETKVPFICILSPILTFGISEFTLDFLNFNIGFLVLPINGLITFFLLLMIKDKALFSKSIFK